MKKVLIFLLTYIILLTCPTYGQQAGVTQNVQVTNTSNPKTSIQNITSQNTQVQYPQNPKNPFKNWVYRPQYGHYYKNIAKDLGRYIKFGHFSKFPVKCWIKPTKPLWMQLIRDTIADYNYFIPTIETNNPDEADIKISIASRNEIGIKDGEGVSYDVMGLGGCTYSPKGKQGCFVMLRPEAFTESLPRIVIAHEMGHAFGLGHSDQPGDLMYYKTGAKSLENIQGRLYLNMSQNIKKPMDQAHFFTSRDVNTLWVLYNQW